MIVLLRNLERSRLGRAWVAIREDELAATCMGINAARVKLSAFALGCGLAGMAGCLYATTLTSTAGPDAFDFNRSIIMLCCVILGGLGKPARHAAGRGAVDRLRQRRGADARRPDSRAPTSIPTATRC